MKIVDDYKYFVENKKLSHKITTIFLNPCFHSVVLYRLSSFFYKIKLGILAKIIWYINRVVFNVDIDYKANLAGGFMIVHGFGVVIGSGVTSKGRLKVYQGVTIGDNGAEYRIIDDRKVWMPQIGDNVTLYTDAKLFGPIKIQENSVIKAGKIVSHDFITEE